MHEGGGGEGGGVLGGVVLWGAPAAVGRLRFGPA